MNSAQLIGRLTKDPVVKWNGEMPIARFTLAVDRKNKNKDTDFIQCVAFYKTAEIIEKYLAKGKLVGVEGSIQTGSYEKDGQKVYTTDVVISRLDILEWDKQENHVGGMPFKKTRSTWEEVSDENIPF